MVMDLDVVALAPQKNEVRVAGNRLRHRPVVGRTDELRFRKYLREEIHEIALPPLVQMKVDLVDADHRRPGQRVGAARVLNVEAAGEVDDPGDQRAVAHAEVFQRDPPIVGLELDPRTPLTRRDTYILHVEQDRFEKIPHLLRRNDFYSPAFVEFTTRLVNHAMRDRWMRASRALTRDDAGAAATALEAN